MSSALRDITPDMSPVQILQLETAWQKSPEERAAMTLACHDADALPRVADAGSMKQVNGRNVQVMHNGLRVEGYGYQGSWQAKIIEGLRGVHEPQEEKAYAELIKRCDPGSTMLELGSWWSFYSMWFLKEVPKAKAYCTEPDPENIALGRRNAELNGFKENRDIFFRQYAAGADDGKQISFVTESKERVKVPIRTIDSMLKEEGIKHLEVLHFDIQGAELETLKGAEASINAGRIRFVCISTHHYSISDDPDMHQKCLDFIKQHGGHIIASHTIFESCSGDGLIVASFDKRDKDFYVEVSRQPANDSLFRPAETDTAIMANAYQKLQKLYFSDVKGYQKDIENQVKQMQKLQKDLEREINTVYELRAQLQEITPLRKHVTKSVKNKVKSTLKR